MRTEGLSEAQRWLLRAGGIGAALLLWEIAGRILGERLLAPPSIVFPQYVQMLRDGTMLATLADSLRQMFVAYALALLIGMPLGIAMGRSRVCDALVHPWVSIFVSYHVGGCARAAVHRAVGHGAVVPRLDRVHHLGVVRRARASYHGARGLERRYVDVGRAFAARAGTRSGR